MAVTTELLDALLSPSGAGGGGGQRSPRAQAEHHLSALALPDRAAGLLGLLLRTAASTASSAANAANAASVDAAAAAASADQSRAMLAAVLLRRDIAALGGGNARSATGLDNATALTMLREMVPPLLQLFLGTGSGGGGGGSGSTGTGSKTTRRQVGHCLAELCLSCSVLGGGAAAAGAATASEVMAQVLTGIGPGCSAADPTSLLLLSDLAERSPITLWSSSGTNGEALAGLFQGVLTSLQSSSGSGDQVEASLEAVVQVAIASDEAAAAAAASGSTGANDILRAIQSQSGGATNKDGSGCGEGRNTKKVVPSSPASHLGKATLPTLLHMVASGNTSTSANDADSQQRCMQTLAHAATHCPSLLAGDMQTLTCLLQTCLGIAQTQSRDVAADPDAATVALSALEVLASLVDVTDVRKKVVLTSKLAGTNGMANLLQMLLAGPSGDQNGAIRICAAIITNGVDDDVESWSADPPSLQSDAANSWEDDDSAMYAESLLESFLRHLGGGTATLPVVLPLIEALMNAPEWRNHRAALSILERCSEAAPVTFAQHVPVAIEAALNLASAATSNARVQLQALQLLGALCCHDTVEDDPNYSPPANATPIQVRSRYGGRILQVASTLVASPCAKVSAHACLVLVSFCRGGNGKDNCGVSVPKDGLVPYLQDVLTALASGPLSLDVSDPSKVNGGAVVVLVRAINTVACLADAAGADFAPYYNNIMPGLLGCSQFGLQIDPNGGVRAAGASAGLSHDFATLRGSAIESATIVGEAVENESLFVPDAEKIVGTILPILKSVEAGNEAASSFIPMDQLLAASARIASVMGERYAQFMPAVLPHLLKRVREEAEVSVVEGDDAGLEATKREGAEIDEEKGTEAVTFALPGVGLRKLILNTSQMQEKSSACRAIYAHASALGGAFGPFAAECTDALLPLVTFKYSADVRSTSAQALAPAFDAACAGALAGIAPADLPMNALRSITKSLVQQLETEDKDDDETVFALADALSDVLRFSLYNINEADGRRIAQLSVDEARTIVKQVISIMKSCLERRAAIISAITGGYDGVAPDEDESAQLYDQLMAEERNLTPLLDSIGYTLKSLGEAFVPIFKSTVAPFFSPLLTVSGTADVRARFAAVALFDDCVEHCGSAAAARYSPYLAEAVVEGMDDTKNEGDEDLKVASIYGVAQIARHAPANVLDSSINVILAQLTSIIKSAEGVTKNDMEDARVVENAVSALASVAIFDNSPYAKLGQRATLLPLFLNNLPLREDPDEAQICHDGLCDLIECGAIDASVNAPTLLNIFGQIRQCIEEEGEEIATPETCNRLGAIVRSMSQQVRTPHKGTNAGLNDVSPDCVTGIY